MSITIGESSLDPAPHLTAEATHVSARRFFAHLVDGIIFTVAALVAIFPVALVAALLPDGGAAELVTGLAVIAVFTVGHVWFLVLLHRKDGRSPGKRLLGIRVVDSYGKVPGSSALWKRSWPIIIEYFYVVAWVGMMSSPYRQRFGDRWGDTYVIRDP